MDDNPMLEGVRLRKSRHPLKIFAPNHQGISVQWVDKLDRLSQSKNLFADFPLAESAGRTIKVDTHLDDGKTILLKADGIILHVNLSQGFFC